MENETSEDDIHVLEWGEGISKRIQTNTREEKRKEEMK